MMFSKKLYLEQIFEQKQIELDIIWDLPSNLVLNLLKKSRLGLVSFLSTEVSKQSALKQPSTQPLPRIVL